MSNSMKISLVSIVSIAAVAAAFAFSGRYHVTTIRFGAAGGYIMMADRFTGTVFMCTGEFCRPVPYQPEIPKSTAAPGFGENDPVVTPPKRPKNTAAPAGFGENDPIVAPPKR